MNLVSFVYLETYRILVILFSLNGTSSKWKYPDETTKVYKFDYLY